MSGAYSYALTERSTLGVTIGAFSNRYDSVGNDATLSNNRGYSAGGNFGYAYSGNTQITFAASYSDYKANIADNYGATTTIGIVHQYSPQLTISISGGWFWSDVSAAQSALVCPAAQDLCDTGVVQPVSISSGDRRRASGGLYGGSIGYAFSERARLYVGLAETLTPSGAGLLSKSESAGASLTYQISDHLTGRLGATYTRTIFPAVQTSSYNDNFYQGEIGVSYQLAERWTLEGGYRYAAAKYSQSSSEPRSNVGFVSIAYNWPGTSFTDWLGRSVNVQGLPGAGPLSLPESSRGRPDMPPASASPETSRFDPFTLP